MNESITVLPRINVLTPEAIQNVHKSSLKILSDIGIRVDSEKALKIFKTSSEVKFLNEKYLIIQPKLVEWAIQHAPLQIDIYNRTGNLAFRLGQGHTRFGIGVTNLFFQEPETSKILPFTRAHMRRSVGLGNNLSSYDIISTIGVIRDVETNQADLIALLEMIANTTKPLIILVSDENQFLPCLHLLEALVPDLPVRPFVIPYFNPVTPLILNQSTADNMVASVEHGLPIIFSNYGMAGMSTPITSAGILTLLNAELLAGLVFSQLIKPGAPVILGSLPAFFDMKTMIDFYDPQTMLLNLACAEMMDFYQIPHAGTSGCANGWGADLIASEAILINQLTSCIGKVSLAPFVGGSFSSKVFSPEVVIFADEVINQSRQFSKGFKINDETVPIEEMKRIGVGGNYISSHQTMKSFREAYHSSAIFPRFSLEKWQEYGKPDAGNLLRTYTLDLMNQSKYPDDQGALLRKGEFLISQYTKLQ